MTHSPPETPVSPVKSGAFPLTSWSVVVQAGDSPSAEANRALATLCRLYWYPLYAYIRRTTSAGQAEDLTQAFFVHLLEDDVVAHADPDRGRFRTFLLACCRHFLTNEGLKARAVKRGGNLRCLSLEVTTADERYRQEASNCETPETLFERRWAVTLLEQVLHRLAEEFRTRGQGELFEHLRTGLVGADRLPYEKLSRALGKSEAALRKAAQRMRGRYRELLLEQIAATVATEDEIEDELRHLFTIVSR